MKTLAIIPMRGGSKGIQDKNIANVGGKALCRWTIEQALKSKLDKVIVATDSAQYKELIDLWYPEKELVPFLMPDNITGDRATSAKYIPWILDWVDQNLKEKYDTFVLLEPTSPLRCPGNINEALMQMEVFNAPAVLAVAPSHRCHPAISFRLSKRTKGYLKPNTDIPHPIRQQLDPFYHPTGLLYAANIAWYQQHKTFMSDETLAYPVNDWQDYEIDTPLDINICETVMKVHREDL